MIAGRYLARSSNSKARQDSCTLERISYIPFVVAIDLQHTHNQERRHAMKLVQAIQVYQEYHRMNSGKKYD